MATLHKVRCTACLTLCFPTSLPFVSCSAQLAVAVERQGAAFTCLQAVDTAGLAATL